MTSLSQPEYSTDSTLSTSNSQQVCWMREVCPTARLTGFSQSWIHMAGSITEKRWDKMRRLNEVENEGKLRFLFSFGIHQTTTRNTGYLQVHFNKFLIPIYLDYLLLWPFIAQLFCAVHSRAACLFSLPVFFQLLHNKKKKGSHLVFAMVGGDSSCHCLRMW